MLLNRPLFPLFSLIFACITVLSACGGGGSSDNNQNNDSRPVTVPQNIQLTAGTRINELNWSGVNGASGYTVYWSNNADVTPDTGIAAHTLQPHFVHRGLANGLTYYYTITSDTEFGQSKASETVSGTPRTPPPAQPDDLDLQPGNSRVTLRWNAIPGATRYTLYWKNTAGVTPADTRIERVVSPFVHHGLENGRNYYYRLVAENAQGPGEGSEEQSTAPFLPLPGAPLITRADVASGQVTLHWQPAGLSSEYELYWSSPDPLSENVSENNTPLTQVTSPYTHTPLQNGQTYNYRVRARNSAGTSVLSNAVQITPPDDVSISNPGTVPAIPTDLTVSPENGQLSLSWTPVDDALGYNLYWKSGETGGAVTLNDSGFIHIQPPYTHIQLNNGTRYRYRLSAFNDHGESPLTTEINGIPQEIIPGVPTGVQALAGDESILVRWNPVQNASGYQLIVNEDIHTDISSPYRITDLTNATSYQIQLQAQNTQGLSARSAPVNATPREPEPNSPRQLTARPANATVLLQWTAATPQNAGDLDETITGYRVYYATRAGVRPGNSTLIDAAPTLNDDGRWQLSHTGLQNNRRYYYVVSAQNAGGEGGLSQEVWARPQVPVPDVPGNLWAEAGDGQVLIHFTSLDTPSGTAEPYTYNLYWTRLLSETEAADRGENRSLTEIISNISPGHRFTDGENTNGSTYFFRVSAVNAGGEGSLSTEISATPQIPAPEQPPQNPEGLAVSNQVTLNWSPVAQASGYILYWSTEPDINIQTSNRLSGDDIQPGFVHTALDNGQSYYYRLAALNAGGESTLSALIAVQPQIPPPATPTNFTVQSGDGQVVINFDPGAAATRYQIFWHPNNDVPFTQWSSRSVQPGDTLINLRNGQPYFHRLQAHNAGGSSALTEPVTATPRTAIPAVPTGLAVATGDSELNITWHTRPGLFYTLYWSDNPDIAPVDSGNALVDVRPAYRHTGLSNNIAYRYQISARNDGGESPPGEPVQAIPDGFVPGIPQALSAEGGLQQVTLRWLPPANATDAIQYTLYWSTTPGQGTSGTALTAISSPYVHTGLNDNQRYYYVITATDGSESLASPEVDAVSAGVLPAQPQGVQGSIGDTGEEANVLQWQTVANAEQYTVQWSPQADMSNSQSVIVTAPLFVHDFPPADILYYRVIAHNATGDSPPSAIVQIVRESPNQAPQITGNDTISITMDEDSTPTAFALTLSATDNDNDSLTWTLTSQASRGTALVESNNTSASVLYNPQANINGSDVFTVQVDDGQGGTDTIRIDVSITPQNDAPAITHTNAVSVAENTPLLVATISAEDIDSDALNYRLSGGEDQDLFSLDNEGQLRFNSAPDYETPADTNDDNDYKIQIIVNDGTVDSAPLDLTLTITDINDEIPLITNVANLSVSEQTTAVTTITVADNDSDTFIARISGGDDNAFFSLTGNDLTFTDLAPTILNPGDADGDNQYLVSVIANDGANDSEPMNFAITVTGTALQRWSEETPVNSDDAGHAFKPQIVLDNDGNGLAIWSRQENTEEEYIVWVNRYVAGTGWGTAEPIGTNNSAVDGNAPPQLAMDANGNALAIWTRSASPGNNTVWASHYVVDSGWGTAEPIGHNSTETTGATIAHQIAMDANGNAHVTWWRFGQVLNRIWTNRYVTGTGWGIAEPIENTRYTTGLLSHQIAVDDNGNGIMVWIRFDPDNNNFTSIWASRYIVGSGWNTAEPINANSTERVVFPDIAMDAKGNGVAVWAQVDGTSINIRASRYVAGTGWGIAEPVGTGAMENVTLPKITMDPVGNALVVWAQSDGTSNNIWSHRYVVDSGWGTAESIKTNGGANPLSLQTTIDARGDVRVVWAESDGTPPRDSIWSNRYVIGSGWSNVERISSIGTEETNVNRAPQPQIAVDADGNALAVWSRYDGTRETIWSNNFE